MMVAVVAIVTVMAMVTVMMMVLVSHGLGYTDDGMVICMTAVRTVHSAMWCLQLQSCALYCGALVGSSPQNHSTYSLGHHTRYH